MQEKNYMMNIAFQSPKHVGIVWHHLLRLQTIHRFGLELQHLPLDDEDSNAAIDDGDDDDDDDDDDDETY